MTVNYSTVSGNSAGRKGGGIDTYGSLTVNNSTISGNSAKYGGGITNFGPLTVTNSILSGNTAGNYGGGIANLGSLTVTGSTVSGNKARDGGGIADLDGSDTLVNSTISGNTGTVTAAILNFAQSGNAALTLINDTLAFNSGSVGGIRNFADSNLTATVNLQNTIVGDNTGPNFQGTLNGIVSKGDNLSGDSSLHLNGIGDLNDVNPLLGPLADHGGPTQTILLLAGSPALDAGGSVAGRPTTDQRGQPRVTDLSTVPNAQGGDGSDIGAVEMQPAVLTVDTIADSASNGGHQSDTLLTLREAMMLCAGTLDPGQLSSSEKALVSGDPGAQSTIVFAPNVTGAIDLTGALPLVTDVSIQGPGANVLAVNHNSGGAHVVFFLAGTSSIDALTIGNLDPSSGSIGVQNIGTLTLSNSVVSGQSFGNGIFNFGTLIVTKSTINDNSTAGGGNGGGINNDGGTVTLTNSTVSGNTAGGDGGGIYSTGGTVTLTNSTVSGNSASVAR